MPAVMCTVCDGKGYTEHKESPFKTHLEAGMIGANVADMQRENNLIEMGLYRIVKTPCYNCGGSGCKWEND